MDPGSKYFNDLRDRAAYVYIAGNFPSHLRIEFAGALRQVTRVYRKPSSLYGRVGVVKLDDDVARTATEGRVGPVPAPQDEIVKQLRVIRKRILAKAHGSDQPFDLAPEHPARRTHVLNLLHRLIDGKVIDGPPLDTPQALALHRAPKANVERYDGLRAQIAGGRHVS